MSLSSLPLAPKRSPEHRFGAAGLRSEVKKRYAV
jgi:hypothetical protein